jgi:hypothetical protein
MKDDVFSLAVGDFNLYSHAHRNIFAIKANESLVNIKKAYLNSVALSGVSFTKHVDDQKFSFVGLNNSQGDYLDYTLTKETAEKMRVFGIDPYAEQYMYDAIDEYDVEDGDDPVYLFDGDDNFVSLLMDFIKVSLPHLEYSLLSLTDNGKSSLPTFNDVDGGRPYDIGYMFEFESCYIFDR